MVNLIAAIVKALESVGKLVLQGFKAAHAAGLTDEVVHAALEYVERAADTIIDNNERREWVVQKLMERFHLPERIARYAVETAIQLWHEKTDGVDNNAPTANHD